MWNASTRLILYALLEGLLVYQDDPLALPEQSIDSGSLISIFLVARQVVVAGARPRGLMTLALLPAAALVAVAHLPVK